MDTETQQTIIDILNSFDDGPRACTGNLSSGELVWKGSFIAFMERLRQQLPSECREALWSNDAEDLTQEGIRRLRQSATP